MFRPVSKSNVAVSYPTYRQYLFWTMCTPIQLEIANFTLNLLIYQLEDCGKKPRSTSPVCKKIPSLPWQHRFWRARNSKFCGTVSANESVPQKSSNAGTFFQHNNEDNTAQRLPFEKDIFIHVLLEKCY